MLHTVRSSRPARLLAFAAGVAATALLLTGCAGQPSPVAKAVAGANEPAKVEATTITSVTPATGSISGGTVTIGGTNLAGVKTVEIGGQPATVQEASGSKVVVAVPAAVNFQPATVAVSVTTASGKSFASENAYSYQVVTPVDKQLNYALTYWKNYNSAEWGDLNPVGGDCANFVSQTLIARGWTQTAAWYNKNAAAKWSPSWGYVPAMDNYFRSNAGALGLTEYPLDQRDKIKVGDIVMFDWNDNNSLDHVQIVSGVQNVGGKISIKMAGHNTDSDYRDLDETITVDHPGAIGHFWSLSK
ncbi:amidase domain-containing protein [Leifsonia sp. NPDC058230]|uniref:amidase domain-containing protein n=1 Tax=Leifsonia sp. NPDC058230 TaxID=3346391 RepID=UPI0036DF2EFC